MKIITCFSFLLLTTTLFCQSAGEPIQCYFPIKGQFFQQDALVQLSNSTGSINIPKVVRINFHFILRSDGTGNMTETGDNLGTVYTGYDMARDFVNSANNSMRWNEPISIPPGNTTAVIPKNITYSLESVYFHRNNSWFNLYPNYPSGAARNMDSVCNVFIYGLRTNQAVAGDVSHFSQNKYISCGGLYGLKYKNYIDSIGTPGQYSFSSVLHDASFTLNHEMGHLLGLNHTVKNPSGINCPTYPLTNYNCGDACDDTPSAWYMVDSLGTLHPGCGWGLNASHCSNNVMDYGGQNALTPCQINIMHVGLDGGMKRYSVCTAVMSDKTYCSLIQNKLSYYGQNLSMGCNASSHNEIGADGNRYLDLYFSSTVEFYGSWDVKQKQTLDIYHLTSCP